MRRADGAGELPLPTWQAFAGTQLLDQLTLEPMLAKLSTRRYGAGLEPVGTQVERTANRTSKSAVSRRFVAATEQALAEGAAKNATVVTDLLAELRQRGLEVTRPILVVIDGAKALRRAVVDVFNHPVQRCQLHKLRNVTDRLPDALASTVAKRMRRAYHCTDPLIAQG